MRKPRGRKTRRDEILGINAWHRFYGAAFDKPEVAERLCQPVPKERAARTPSGKPLERDVLKAVVMALRYDPRVARVDRNQSGVFQDGNRFIRVGSRGKLDLTVYLKSGKYLELEIKRGEGEKLRPEQESRINEIRAQGGLAGWCWSVESALALLP